MAYLVSISSGTNCPQHHVSLLRRETRAGGRFYYKCPYNECRTFRWEDEMLVNNTNSASADESATSHHNASSSNSSNSSGNSSSSSEQLPEVHLMVVAHPNDCNLRPQQQRPALQVTLPKNMVTMLKSTVESIQGHMRSPVADNIFHVPIEMHTHVVRTFNMRRTSRVRVKEVPSKVFHMLNMYSAVDITDSSPLPPDRLPEKLFRALKPFQMEGVHFGLQRNGRIMLADEMGLGKTIQAIALAYLFAHEWPLLIICPSSLRFNWSKELEEWLVPHIQPQDIKILLTGKDRPSSRINIISYDLVKGDIYDYMTVNPFKVIIADECHYLKNPTAQRTKNIRPLIQNSARAIMITGTPALSRPIELFTQMEALIRQQGYDHWFGLNEYRFRYCDAKVVHGYLGRPMIEDKGFSNLEELNLVLGRTVMIRRLKKDVLKELPKKNRQVVRVQVSKSDMKKLKRRVQEFVDESRKSRMARLPGDYEQHQRSFHNKYMQTYHTTGIAKLKAVSSYVKELIELDWCKFIIFGHHREVLDGIEKTLKSVGVGYMRIDGQTPAINRKQYCDRFQEDDMCKVALLSLKAANVGLTLTVAKLVLFAELGFTPGDHLQAEDRVHRIGQRDDVIIRYILGEGTLDDALWPMLECKLEVMGKTLDANANATSDFIDAKVSYESSSSSISMAGANNSVTLDNYFNTDEHIMEDDPELDTYDDGSGFVEIEDGSDGRGEGDEEEYIPVEHCQAEDISLQPAQNVYQNEYILHQQRDSDKVEREWYNQSDRDTPIDESKIPAEQMTRVLSPAVLLGINNNRNNQQHQQQDSLQEQRDKNPFIFRKQRTKYTSKSVLHAIYSDYNRNCVNLQSDFSWSGCSKTPPGRQSDGVEQTQLNDDNIPRSKRDVPDGPNPFKEKYSKKAGKSKSTRRPKPKIVDDEIDNDNRSVASSTTSFDARDVETQLQSTDEMASSPTRNPSMHGLNLHSTGSPRTPKRSLNPDFSRFTFTPPSSGASHRARITPSKSPLSRPLFTSSRSKRKLFADDDDDTNNKRHKSLETTMATVSNSSTTAPPTQNNEQGDATTGISASQWEQDFMSGLL